MEKKYILFGAGAEGRNALNFFGSEKIAYFCDNKKFGQFFEGIKVISIRELENVYSSYSVIITTSVNKYLLEIALQLNKYGIPFLLFEDEARKYIEKDLQIYSELNKRRNFDYKEEYSYPLYLDKVMEAGYLHSYFWQDLWAAQRIFEVKPEIHFDIGSRIDGFIAHLLSFRQKVKVLDIRPLNTDIPNVDFLQCDATNLDNIADGSILSMSALCSLEHFGLGRFGDPIDPEACFKCFSAIQRKMAAKGRLYISIPVGKEHLEFNAHRIFYASTIVNSFNRMDLKEYSITNGKEIDYNINIHKYDEFSEKGGDLFGLFIFEKR